MNLYTCHQAKEIVPGLILGGIDNLEEMLALGVDVLVPLDRAPASIWARGWRGELLYCPIRDGGVLPEDVLARLVETICGHLRDGRRVGIFCLGGHGRTGYVAACVLARLGEAQPLRLLKQQYCVHAVETEAQAQSWKRFC